MTPSFDSALDLTIARVIKAPRSVVWNAWADPRNFEQWWIPAPTRCKVVAMDLQAGGAFETEMSDDGAAFVPHVKGCFLAVDAGARIVFTNALTGGWRPAERSFVTAIITMRDHPLGTDYAAHVMHKSGADRAKHEDMGFYDGWGTCLAQLAALAEQRA